MLVDRQLHLLMEQGAIGRSGKARNFPLEGFDPSASDPDQTH